MSQEYLNKTVVTINNQQYALKGEESVARMEDMAKLVDDKINLLKKAFPNCNPVPLYFQCQLQTECLGDLRERRDGGISLARLDALDNAQTQPRIVGQILLGKP